jgi:hypothetical protein
MLIEKFEANNDDWSTFLTYVTNPKRNEDKLKIIGREIEI